MYKIFLFIPICLLMNIQLYAQHAFQKTYAQSSSSGMLGSNEISVIQTFDGNYCIAGTVIGNNNDIYLMKLSVAGDTLWTKTYGGNFDDEVYSLEQTVDSGLVMAGRTRSFGAGLTDGYVIKTDSEGNLEWSKSYGGTDFDLFNSIYPTNDNGYIICGTTCSFSLPNLPHVYAVKIDSVGNIQWGKALAAGGYFTGSSVRPALDKGYIIASAAYIPNQTSGGIYLLKLDSVGNQIWSYLYGGTLGDGGLCVRQCNDGAYAVTGYSGGDLFLLKATDTGNVLWMKTYGGIASEMGYQMEITNDNGFILTGRTSSFGSVDYTRMDVYLVRTNSVGDTLWTRAFPSLINGGYSVKQTNDGGFILATNTSLMTIFKTNSLGEIGCDDFPTNTIVNSVTPSRVSWTSFCPAFGALNAPTITGYQPMSAATLCLTTGLNYNAGSEVKPDIFPIPCTNYLRIKTKGLDELMDAEIYSLTGQHVLVDFKTTSEYLQIDTSLLPSGIYTLRLSTAHDLVSSRFLKID